MPDVTIGLAFFAGFLSFISPCVLPLIPAYITYLGGRVALQTSAQVAATSGGTVGAGTAALTGLPGQPTQPVVSQEQPVQPSRLGTVLHALVFIAGFTFVFVTFGLLVNAGARAISSTSYALQELIGRIGGLIIIFFGLQLLGVTGFVLNFLTTRVNWAAWGVVGDVIYRGLERLKAMLYSDTRRQVRFQHDKYGYIGSAIMGIAFAAGWSPCIGPIYGSILTMAANLRTGAETTTHVATLLLAYSLGLGVPFLVSAIMLEQMRALIKKFQKQMRAIEIISGCLLVIIGFLLFTNQFARLSQALSPLADFSYDVETCTMAVIEGNLPASGWTTCVQNKGEYPQPSASNQLRVDRLVFSEG